MLHEGDTCTLFLMPASVNTFGYTPLYTFVFSECLICVEHEDIQPSLFESIGTTMVVSHPWDLCI